MNKRSILVALFVFPCLVLAPIVASAQAVSSADPMMGRLLDLVERQSADNRALNEKLIGLLADALKQPATNSQSEIQGLRNLVLQEQSLRQISVATAPVEKQGWVSKYLVPSLASFGGGFGGAYLGSKNGGGDSFKKATELVRSMPQPVQNLSLSSYSGGSTSQNRTFVGGSSQNSSNTARTSGGNSSAMANPNVNTSANSNAQGGTGYGGTGGAGGNANANAQGGEAFSNSNSNSNSYSNSYQGF